MTIFRMLILIVVICFGLVFFSRQNAVQQPEYDFAAMCAEHGGTLIEVNGQQSCAGVK